MFIKLSKRRFFFSRKPRGVKSKRIRQKERLVRYETPPSAAGGGTPGENTRGETGANEDLQMRFTKYKVYSYFYTRKKMFIFLNT